MIDLKFITYSIEECGSVGKMCYTYSTIVLEMLQFFYYYYVAHYDSKTKLKICSQNSCTFQN